MKQLRKKRKRRKSFLLLFKRPKIQFSVLGLLFLMLFSKGETVCFLCITVIIEEVVLLFVVDWRMS